MYKTSNEFIEKLVTKTPGEIEFHQAVKEVVHSIWNHVQENPEYSHILFDTDEIKYRLASGTVGIQHATNQVIEEGELPMMIAVYIVIIILVFATYLDWRATICCTVPLTFATMLIFNTIKRSTNSK